MWKLCTQDIFDSTVWRADVTDEELADMRSFIGKHLVGEPSAYAAGYEGEGYIVIRHGLTGNPILELFRLNG